VATRQQADQNPVDHGPLPDDDLLHLAVHAVDEAAFDADLVGEGLDLVGRGGAGIAGGHGGFAHGLFVRSEGALVKWSVARFWALGEGALFGVGL
jgi:hypothetical protein